MKILSKYLKYLIFLGTEPSTSGWCATSAYENTMEYNSYRYCTEDDWKVEYVCPECETTVHGEYCRPFYYDGEMQDGCYGDTYSWCATEVDESNSYTSWDYCGKGDADEDDCVFPFYYNNIWYDTCTSQSSGSGWCATSTYAIEGTYYSYKYCDEEELALGLTSVTIGAGTTVEEADCTPMIYGNVRYERCTADTYSWCATAVDSNLAYTSYAYCGYGDNAGDDCVYPVIYNGEEYNECIGQDTSSPWCATSVYENTVSYYSYKYW